MIKKDIFRAKALYFRLLINHGLKAVVNDNESFMDFNPKFLSFVYLSKSIINN